ncbi:MAG: LPS export ABC transporter periplasmic protein LptC [candidate division Zixibacteria bacterium]
MKFSDKIIFFSMILYSCLMMACGEESIRPPHSAITLTDSIQPDQVTTNAHIYLYKKGYKTTDLLADEIQQFTQRDSMIAINLHADFYDSLGQRLSTLTSKWGYIRQDDNFMAVNGEVVLIGEDSVTLLTEYLEWDGQKDSVVTDSFVTIIRPGGDTLTSREGMQSDPQLKNISFKKASGRLTDVEKVKDENR